MRRKSLIWIIGIFGGSSTALAVAFLLLVSVTVVMFSSGGSVALQACAPNDTTGGSGVVQAKVTKSSIPSNYLKLYVDAGKEWNIPWNVLAGIGYIESHHGTLTEGGKSAEGVHSGENFAGAGGPMQFLQSTFDSVKVDGDRPPDGKMSRYDPDDAIFSAAKLLKVHILGIGASPQELKSRTLTAAEIRRSLFSYNHSDKYVNDVLAQANRYAKDYDVTSANYAGTGMCSGLITQGGPFGQRIANRAAYFARVDPGTPRPPNQKDAERGGEPTPYSWGGGNKFGPRKGICCSPGGYSGAKTVGFDCSGLALHAVYVASGGKIEMPRTTWAMWASNKGVKFSSRNQLAPGDLVFFNNDLSHMGIYYGEVNGVRWMVEAPRSGDDVKFSKFDERPSFQGALRVTPPAGMENESPGVIRAMAPAGAGVGGGAM